MNLTTRANFITKNLKLISVLIFYLKFIYTSCTTYSLYLFFSSLAQSTSYARGLVDYSLRCARGLLRPPSTFTFPTRLGDLSTTLYTVLEDCADHRAHLRFQPRSGTCPPVPTPCSGTVPTTEHVYILNSARGLVNHSLYCARGLLWSLSNHSLGTILISYIWIGLIYNWGVILFLDLATRLILRLPASSGTTSVRCIWRCISVLEFLRRLFWSWHHMPTSPTTRLGD